MSDKLNHEKYISIDYDKWESFYKPLENKLKRVEQELETEKRNKQHKVYMRFSSMYSSSIRDNVELATVELNVPTIFNDKFTREFGEALQHFMYGSHYSRNRKIMILDEDHVKEALIKIGKAREESNQFQLRFEMWYMNLPKFIKWLFKLKPKPNES